MSWLEFLQYFCAFILLWPEIVGWPLFHLLFRVWQTISRAYFPKYQLLLLLFLGKMLHPWSGLLLQSCQPLVPKGECGWLGTAHQHSWKMAQNLQPCSWWASTISGANFHTGIFEKSASGLIVISVGHSFQSFTILIKVNSFMLKS